MKRNRIIALLLCLALLLAGCASAGANQESSYDIAVTMPAERNDGFDYGLGLKTEGIEETMPAPTAPGESGSSQDALSGQKLIRTVYLDAQTQEYDALMTALDAKISELGGYVESRDAYNGSAYYGSRSRNCSMVIRIPAQNLSAFVAHVNDSFNVTNTSETVENITLQYVDTAARVEALKTEQARLMELLSQAMNLSEILEIEARLSDVSYELESHASRLRVYDNLVDYATVHLDVDEVQKLTPVEEPTMLQRIADGFSQTLEDVAEWAEDVVVWFVVNLPWICIWAVIGFCAGFAVTKLFRRRKARRAPPAPPASPENDAK